MTRLTRLAVVIAVALRFAAPAVAETDPAALYARDCARCHDVASPDIRAPGPDAMKAMTTEGIIRALESGSMKPLARNLSAQERVAVAAWLTGKPLVSEPVANGGRCPNVVPAFVRPFDRPGWNGWGADLANTRSRPASAAGITVDNVARLKLKWAFGFAGAISANAQPTVVGGRVFVGGGDRKVHALDARTGCVIWEFASDAPVRTAIMIGRAGVEEQYVAYFGDVRANA